MTRHPFAPAAQPLWDDISPVVQQSILDHVWCGHCRTSRRIEDFTGVPEHGGIRLQGFCAACGHVVVRLIEPPDAPISKVIPIRKPAATVTALKPKRVPAAGRKKLLLTGEQVALIIECAMLDDTVVALLHRSPMTDGVVAVRGTPVDWEEMAGYVAAEANHTKDKKLRKQLDSILDVIDRALRPAGA